MQENLLKRKSEIIYSILLVVFVCSIYFSSLFNPPRSDYWHLFYSFHELENAPPLMRWLNLLNYDNFEKMRYQPLSRLSHYFLYLTVGSNFLFFNLFNLVLYIVSIVLLYKFASIFCNNKIIPKVFAGLFAVLFTHADIVLWSYHVYVIAGFCSFLIGFLSYINFLKERKTTWLFSVVFLFLVGMLFYESFFLWPFAILILSGLQCVKCSASPKATTLVKPNTWVLMTVYILYFALYIFTRLIKTNGPPTHTLGEFLKIPRVLEAGSLVLFSFLYNNVIANIYPVLLFPLRVTENPEFGGYIANLIDANYRVIFIGAAFVFCSIGICSFYLIRKRYFEEIKVVVLFLFLLFSESYVIFFCRLITNDHSYSFRQFRYQYVPNALTIMLVIFLAGRFLQYSKWRRRILWSLLAFIFIVNIHTVRRLINIYDSNFTGLKTIISNIRDGIRKRYINVSDKLYLDDALPDYLPGLSWNIEQGERFMQGNYRWMFSKRDNEFFSSTPENASWVIDKGNFSVQRKSLGFLSRGTAKINATISHDYIEAGKDETYVRLSDFYKQKGDSQRSEAMLEKALELNPLNKNTYLEFSFRYSSRGKYREAESMLKKAISIDPSDSNLYSELGVCYKAQAEYREAEIMFKKTLAIKDRDGDAYYGLGSCYFEQGQYQEAEASFRKALEINPQNKNASNDLQRAQDALGVKDRLGTSGG